MGPFVMCHIMAKCVLLRFVCHVYLSEILCSMLGYWFSFLIFPLLFMYGLLSYQWYLKRLVSKEMVIFILSYCFSWIQCRWYSWIKFTISPFSPCLLSNMCIIRYIAVQLSCAFISWIFVVSCSVLSSPTLTHVLLSEHRISAQSIQSLLFHRWWWSS